MVPLEMQLSLMVCPGSSSHVPQPAVQLHPKRTSHITGLESLHALLNFALSRNLPDHNTTTIALLPRPGRVRQWHITTEPRCLPDRRHKLLSRMTLVKPQRPASPGRRGSLHCQQLPLHRQSRVAGVCRWNFPPRSGGCGKRRSSVNSKSGCWLSSYASASAYLWRLPLLWIDGVLPTGAFEAVTTIVATTKNSFMGFYSLSGRPPQPLLGVGCAGRLHCG